VTGLGEGGSNDHAAVVELELPDGRSFDAVGRLVAAGVAGRAGLPVDRIDRLQLALQAVRRDPRARGTTRISLTSSQGELQAEIGPLSRTSPDGELEDVLSTLVKDVEMRVAGEDTWITLRLPIPAATEAR
jgi:hypothetical protein